jgi:hypothetical protein
MNAAIAETGRALDCAEGEGIEALSKASINPLGLVAAIGRMLGHTRAAKAGLADIEQIHSESRRRT